MGEEELQATIARLLTDAKSFADDELEPLRRKATDYYLGKPFGNEEEGRSQNINTVVRDAVDAVVPSMVEVFFGPERVLEYVPDKAETTALAEQATEYVHHVFLEENAGFLQTLSVIKDGLVRRLGVF
jgi:hypothetical protein